MSRIMEEMCDKAAHDKSIEIATKMIQQGKQTIEEIAYITDLSTDEVNELAQKKST